MDRVSRNVKRRSRIRPIARQHPFDVNVCTFTKVNAGDALFVPAHNGFSQQTYDEHSMFTQVKPLVDDFAFPPRNDDFVPKPPEDILVDVLENTKQRESLLDKSMPEGIHRNMLVGFAITGATPDTRRAAEDQIAHLPMTIAGAITVNRDTLMMLLLLSMAESNEQFAHVYGQLQRSTLNAQSANAKWCIHSGFEFVLHGKTLRFIDSACVLKNQTERSRVLHSVSLIVGTLSS